jgi:CHAT domain-containing protein
VVVLSGSKATADRLRQLLPGRKLVHFATHGLFQTEQVSTDLVMDSMSGLSDRRGATLVGATLVQPAQAGPRTATLYRSGLVLSGANTPRRPFDITDILTSSEDLSDDAYLMDSEVLSLPLKETELVVLSACDTALGTDTSGEGVLGLQRAFQVAGARTTIASLWKVDDAATELLMTRFHYHLSQPGTTRLDALRLAQMEMLRSEREENKDDAAASIPEPRPAKSSTDSSRSVSPFYWAAFQLSGDWR